MHHVELNLDLFTALWTTNVCTYEHEIKHQVTKLVQDSYHKNCKLQMQACMKVQNQDKTHKCIMSSISTVASPASGAIYEVHDPPKTSSADLLVIHKYVAH